MNSHGKMAIVLQMCHKDYVEGFELARIMAAMQDSPCGDTEFIFFLSRKLASQIMITASPYREIIQAVKSKFKTFVWTCNRFGEGYPYGAADMWFDLLVQLKLARKSKIISSECALTAEADGLPITKDWHYRLRREWKEGGKPICGHLSTCYFHNKHWPHINGNMVIDTCLVDSMPQLIGCPEAFAWDVYFGEDLVKNATVSEIILNEYRKPSVTREEMFDLRNGKTLAYIHGVRDDSGRKILVQEYGLDVL